MADVLIVCVREDEPQAKALADMFEAAGFTIGGAPGSDAALRSSGAGVIVWSQASIRSRPFLDAAQRVINADKAVVASLIEPPPPSSVGDAPAFDLSRWNGDPDDPSLDPLFFAVDRMVNAARASVGAPTTDEPRLEPRRPAPAPRIERIESSRPTPRPAPPPPAPKPDALETETEYWRAIRDSKNPADFMDYIARYGPQGAFAEVAEIKLKQLTNAANAAPVAPPPPRPTVRPMTPRAEAPPPRRTDPPPRRAESPLPPTRRAEAPLPPRRPAYDRGHDRVDVQDPPRSEGGALRTFILIALLGGAALAGGLYFGGGVGEQPGQQSEQIAANANPQEPASFEDGAASESGAVPLSDAVAERPTQLAEARPTPQRPEPARAETRREPERPRPQERETEPPTPAPTNNWNNPPASGPVSLRPGEQASNTTTSPPVSLNPPTTTPAPVIASTTAPATTQATPPPGAVQFTQRPSARRIAELYPQRAAREGVGGRVTLDCAVRTDLSVACSVASETPAGEGFGRAALAAAGAYRANPRLSNGQPAAGARTRINVNFQAPSE